MKYNTLHKQKILEVINKSKKALTAQEISVILDKQNNHIGLTTIYRQLSNFEENNIVKRINENNESKYIFINNEDIYVKCKDCGELVNLECKQLEETQNHFENEHNIILDLNKTNFVGICKNCNSNGGK